MTAPDAMPEQVEQPTVDEIQAGTAYITADPVAHKVCNWMIAFGRRDAESRLLAAEARAKAMEDGPLDYMSGKCDRLKEENATLRAEREALVPLARLGLWAYDEHQSGGGLWDDEFRDKSFMLGIHVGFGRESEATTQARAILAREAGE